MKKLDVFYSDEEFKQLKTKKEQSGLNWHDFIIEASKVWWRHPQNKS